MALDYGHMKNYLFFALVFLSFIAPANVFAESVPDWVKNISGWWSQGNISEAEFMNAIKYLVENKIISIEPDDQNKLLVDAGIAETIWKTNHFSTWLALHGDLVVLLADTAEVQTLVQLSKYYSSLSSSIDEKFVKDNLLTRFLEFSQYDETIDQVRILDKTGMEMIRINNNNGTFIPIPDAELQDKSSRYYFHESLKLQADDVYRSHIDLNVEHGEIQIPHKPTLRYTTPIHDSSNEVAGFLIVNYALNPILKEYVQSDFCNVSVFDEDGIVIADSDESRLFGNQLENDVNFYELYPEFEEMEEQHFQVYHSKLHGSTVILDETYTHGSERYWHFVCELK